MRRILTPAEECIHRAHLVDIVPAVSPAPPPRRYLLAIIKIFSFLHPETYAAVVHLQALHAVCRASLATRQLLFCATAQDEETSRRDFFHFSNPSSAGIERSGLCVRGRRAGRS